MRTPAPLTLLLLLAACDGTPTPAPPPAAERASPPPSRPIDPAAPPERPFFVGSWAAADTACGHAAWQISETGLSTPGEVSCSFDQVTPIPEGYDITATCTAEGPPQSQHIKFSYATSARALLVEGGPFEPVGLVACGGQQ